MKISYAINVFSEFSTHGASPENHRVSGSFGVGAQPRSEALTFLTAMRAGSEYFTVQVHNTNRGYFAISSIRSGT